VTFSNHVPALARGVLAAAALWATALLPSGTAQADSTVEMRDLAFGPMTAQVSAGETVVWANVEDAMPHNIASGSSGGANNGELFASPILMPGDSFSFTFAEPGEFQYICPLHPAMSGVIIVNPS